MDKCRSVTLQKIFFLTILAQHQDTFVGCRPISLLPKNMDEESNTCVLITTKLDQWEPYSRKEAYAWASVLLRSIVEKAEMRWQGEMKAVIPIGMSVTGCRYKAVLSDVPEEMIDDTIMPGLQGQKCTVQRMQKDLQAQDRKKSAARLQQIQSRVAQVGNVAALNATIDRLSTLHGGGGSEVKRQKFAQGAMSVLKTSVAVASANLEEAKPKE